MRFIACRSRGRGSDGVSLGVMLVVVFVVFVSRVSAVAADVDGSRVATVTILADPIGAGFSSTIFIAVFRNVTARLSATGRVGVKDDVFAASFAAVWTFHLIAADVGSVTIVAVPISHEYSSQGTPPYVWGKKTNQ